VASDTEQIMRSKLLTSAFIALVLLAALGARAHAQSDTVPPFPPPGRLVDIGGWRLHLNCTGTPSSTRATVILEAGIGDFSVEWGLVQPGVAQFARVCSYDRADSGWSDFGPHPRTMHQIVYELHKLLEKADVRPPYVLVGHSYGGWLVQLYRSTYPTEVAGMVLVEGGAKDPWRMQGDGKLVRSSELARARALPPVKTSGPLRPESIPPQAIAQMRNAIEQFASRANEPPRDKLPADAQRMRSWALGTIKHWSMSDNPFEADEILLVAKEREKSEHPYGDLPLIVITRGLSEESGPDSKQFAEEHRKDHEATAKLSRAGKLVVADKSGHHVQIEQPDLVVEAIRQVAAGARR
jgi:pimeloyl-ACP methyl ester carboxylesterase